MLKKIQQHINLTKDLDFANFLGISPQALSNWKTRGTFNHELIYTKCEWINPHWLLTGEGEIAKVSKHDFNMLKPERFNHSKATCISCLEKDEYISLQNEFIEILKEMLKVLKEKNEMIKTINKE